MKRLPSLPASTLNNCLVSGNSNLVGALCDECSVNIVEIGTNLRARVKLRYKEELCAHAISSDGAWLVVATSSALYVHSIKDNFAFVYSEPHYYRTTCITINNNVDVAVGGSPGMDIIHTINITRGARKTQYDDRAMCALKFSPDSKYGCVCEMNGLFYFWPNI